MGKRILHTLENTNCYPLFHHPITKPNAEFKILPQKKNLLIIIRTEICLATLIITIKIKINRSNTLELIGVLKGYN